MVSSTEERSGSRLGNTLRRIGYAWLVLFFVANLVVVPGVIGELIRFFGSNLIIPILLIVAGRVINRRFRGERREEPASGFPSPQPSAPAPPPRPQPRPMSAKPERTTAAVHRREMEDMAEAHEGIRGDKPGDHMKAVEELLDKEMSYKPKTSEEMIAEAHRRWNRES